MMAILMQLVRCDNSGTLIASSRRKSLECRLAHGEWISSMAPTTGGVSRIPADKKSPDLRSSLIRQVNVYLSFLQYAEFVYDSIQIGRVLTILRS